MGFLLSWWKCSRIDCGNGCPTLGIYEQPLNCTEDEMLGWYYWLNGHESEQAPGDSEEQRSLACCSPWGCEELDMTEQLNNWTVHFKWVNCMVCKFYLKKLSPKKKILLGKDSKLHWKEFLLACLFQNDWIHWTYIHLYIYVSEWLLSQSCLTLCDPMNRTHQAPLSIEFSRQEYWSGFPFASPQYIHDYVKIKLIWFLL